MNGCYLIHTQFGLPFYIEQTYSGTYSRTSGEGAQNEMATDSDFHKKIVFSYKALFWLNECINKQNCRLKSVIIQKELLKPRYIHKNLQRSRTYCNSQWECYKAMLFDLLMLELEDVDLCFK